MFAQLMKARQAQKAKSSRRKLRIERMEERQLMAADIFLNTGIDVLYIEGTSSNDRIVVESWGTSDVRASIMDGNGIIRKDAAGNEFREVLDRNAIDRIMAVGGAGHDRITNLTTIPMTALGGTGNDVIQGGYGNDLLFGESGIDTIYGDTGNDEIHGGAHDDKLFGDAGDDSIWGDSGADYLYGGAHHDNLYGGTGYDRLFGESGNDGLFGGASYDRLYAGSGRDRILRDYRNSDAVYHTSSDDAILMFKDSSSGWKWNNGWVFYTGQSWTDSDIEEVDTGLRTLHNATGNTKLLKTPSGSNMTIHRLGTRLTAGINSAGWNSRDGNVSLTDLGMNTSALTTEQLVIHEFAHNWDWEVNSTIDKFRSYSGWTQSSTTESKTYSRATRRWTRTLVANDTGGNTTDNWWHTAGKTNFVSQTAALDPFEDFADTFTAYVMGGDFQGTPAGGNAAAGINQAPGKRAYMKDFVKSLM